MKACLSFLRMRLINGLQYRAAAWAGIFTQFFWGFMEIQLYRALYADHSASFPMDMNRLVSYIWLRQAFWALLNMWTFEGELFDMILNGNVAYELCRPCSMYGMWFARNAAMRIGRMLLRCGPILLVAWLLPPPWHMQLPASWMALGLFLLSMLLALGVTVAFSLIVYFSCFFTLSSDGIRAVLLPVTTFFSGGILPLPFMPDGLARILALLPFGAMVNAPLRIYSGNIEGAAAIETLLLQGFWLAALVFLGRFMQKKGMNKLTLQGG